MLLLLLQILDKELTHLEKAATRLDPLAQRAEAASVKLLASALLQVHNGCVECCCVGFGSPCCPV